MKGKSISRREFLRLAGLAGAGAALASCIPATPAPEKPAEVAPAATPAAEKVTLRYGIHDLPEAREEMLKLFKEQYPNIEVNIEQVGEFSTKVPAMAAAGNLPDVTRMWEAMVLDMGRAGQVIDLNPYVDATPDFHPEDFIEVFWNYPVVAGKRFGIADAAAPHICFYNKDILDQAGVTYPGREKFTWEEFVEKARAISKPEEKLWGSETIPLGWHYYNLKVIWQNGGDMFSPDYKECWLDRPEAYEAIQYWADILLAGDVMPSPTQVAGFGGELVSGQLFQSGRVAFDRMGSWLILSLKEAGVKFKWNIVHEPSKVQRGTILHTAFNAISTKSEHKDEAWKWVDMATSTRGCYTYVSYGKFPGARRSTNQIKPYAWVVEGLEGVDWDVIPETLEYGHVLPGPAHESEAMKLVGDALDAIYHGQRKAKDAFEEIAPKVTAIISAV
jgi:multiple sugar transport system substrate-binding protein